MDNPTPLPTTNTGASIASETVRDIVTLTEKPVEAAIIAAEPFLATPVIMQLWQAALRWVFNILGTVLGRLTGYVFIDIEEYFALKNVAMALHSLKAAQVSGDLNAIEKANAETDAAITPVLHYIGSIKSK